MAAFKGKKHLITMNPELQATVGTELKKLAVETGEIH
jgi:predicted homoserine dehydrogenase-like protein